MKVYGVFEQGDQPCKDFKPMGRGSYFGSNKHECYCKDKLGNYCKLSVSFCENCHNDHHESGYEKCVCRIKTDEYEKKSEPTTL